MKIQFTTRIEEDILNKVKAISEKELRTTNNTIEYLLTKAIELYEKENGKTETNENLDPD